VLSLLAQKRWGEAMGPLEEAIRLAPRMADFYRTRARLNQERQDDEAALRDLELAARLERADSPQAAGDHCERADILYRGQRYHDVIRECNAALAISLHNPVAHRLLAESLLKLQ